MLALVAAAAVANAYHHGSVTNLHFTRMSVNGQYTSRTHLNRVAGVDVAIDAIDCTLMVIDEGKMWQCAVPNNAMVRLGAYNVTCDPSNDKYGFNVGSCTIDYELLLQMTKAVERNLTKVVTDATGVYGGIDFVALLANVLVIGLIIYVFGALVIICWITEQNHKKFTSQQCKDGTVQSNPSPPSQSNATDNTKFIPNPCTHPLLRDLRIECDEQHFGTKLFCDSCGMHVPFSELMDKRDASNKRSSGAHDDSRLSASDCVTSSKKRRSHRARRD